MIPYIALVSYITSYLVVNRASIAFLVDGTNTHHFDVLQKLIYNVVKLFASGSAVSIITYGDSVKKDLATFRFV